jgi:cytochrome c2
MRNVLRHARLLMVGLLIALPHFMRAEVSAEQGKQLFKANCARCHYVTDKRFVGPGLAGVQDRWSDEANLLAWIRNSSDYLKTGDSYATKLFAEYNGSVMPAFQLSDDELRSILAYIAEPGEEAKPATADTDGAVSPEGGKAEGDNTLLTFVLIGAALLLLILARSLNSVSKALENVRREKAGEEPVQEETINV